MMRAQGEPPLAVSDLDYELPAELIAQRPPERRDGGRMMIARGDTLEHRHVRELPSMLEPALFVVNDTRVRAARLFGHKASGGKVEVLLIEQLDDERWLALGRSNKPLRVDAELTLGDGRLTARVLERRERGELVLSLRADAPIEAVLEEVGHMPLPPYVSRADDAEDRARYQTVFAESLGAVAAPTAGLHFSRELLADLEARGHRTARITLHVGPGTFRPVKAERLDEHKMHEERYEVPNETIEAVQRARADGRAVIAVGTTVVRTLESAVDTDGVLQAGAGRTALFIAPPFDFQVVDGLLTNFHLPRSTLLALVMAMAGTHVVRRAYREAIAKRYRFYSYGDAMLIPPREAALR